MKLAVLTGIALATIAAATDRWYLIFFIAVLATYFIPWIIAINRKHMNTSAIALLNIFLGWTFLGWVAALVWAMTNDVAPKVQNAGQGILHQMQTQPLGFTSERASNFATKRGEA